MAEHFTLGDLTKSIDASVKRGARIDDTCYIDSFNCIRIVTKTHNIIIDQNRGVITTVKNLQYGNDS